MDPIEGEFALEFQQSTLAQPVPQAFLETVVQESLKAPARVWRAALDGLIDAEFAEELGRIGAPTLIVWGDRDEFFLRSKQDREEPARFAADLLAFIEKL